MSLPMVSEAVASVSLSHPAACTCTVCKAARGDVRAMALVAEAMAEALVLEAMDRPSTSF